MHIPDGFLSTRVWAAMAVVCAPAVAFAARQARETLDERRVPLLGMMGAFVFAAQMINFPVGVGTSGHLLGAALLSMTVGPAAAAVVMTAIVAVQSLVFQDGGLLALGANIFNMAIVGVGAGYLPFYWLGRGSARTAAIFLGAFLSVLAGAGLALTELWASDVAMPSAVVAVSLAAFAAAAVAEGVITVLALRAIESMNPEWVRQPGEATGRMMLVTGGAAVALVTFGVLVASVAPDQIQALSQQAGFAILERNSITTPFAGYETGWLAGTWLRQTTAGMVGLCLVFILSVGAARLLKRRS